MSLIEGIGDEVTHFFTGVVLILIGYLAWWTTSISEQRHIRTVLLLERRRTHARLSNHTESVDIIEGSSAASDSPAMSTASEVNVAAAEGECSSTSKSESDINHESSGSEDEDDERSYILETMDSNCVTSDGNCIYNDLGYVETASDEVDGISSDNQENVGSSSTGNTSSVSNSTEKTQKSNTTESSTKNSNKDCIRIKLKYLNDDLKMVDGLLQEQLGEFKRRHFQGELSSNKLIRLIFNGQVLQPDTQTLRSCGLFDNCVVHCLIHQKRPSPSEENRTDSMEEFRSHSNRRLNNNQQEREWDLGNIMFIFVSVLLASAWYFRFVYAHYYSLSATVGLTFLTGVFTISFTVIYFPITDFRPRVSN